MAEKTESYSEIILHSNKTVLLQNAAIGSKVPEMKFTYSNKDVILYALSGKCQLQAPVLCQ